MKRKLLWWLLSLVLLWSCNKDNPSPSGPHFTVSPVPVDKLARISQLGENGKIFPVSHTYWTICDERFIILPSGNPCTREMMQIRAPGPGKVVDIVHARDGEVSFEGPQRLRWTFAHVTPDPGLTRGSNVEAGDVIATMTFDFSFDFGLINYAVNHEYIAAHRYPDPGLHAQHPIEQYPEPTRSQLMEKLAGEPKRIGRLSYDVAGTASGGWILDGAPEDVFIVGREKYLLWTGKLAENPESNIVNIGERWPEQPEAYFTYVVDGRDPSWEEITPELGIVQVRLWRAAKSGLPDGIRPLGSLLLQVLDEERLQIEWFDSHDAVSGFTNGHRIYVR